MRRHRSVRALLTGAGALAVGAGLLAATPATAATPPAATPSPAPVDQPFPAGTALSAQLQDEAVLTLPAKDGVRDSVPLRIRSGATGSVDVVARQGKRSVPVADDLALRSAPGGWQRSIAVPVHGLRKGAWRIVVQRAGDETVQAVTRLRVGSGKPVSVRLVPAATTLYPYRDRSLDALELSATAQDETGAALPVSGSIRISVGKRHRTGTMRANAARIPVTGLPDGTATVRASLHVPDGDVERTTTVRLAPTAVGALRVVPTADTVQPVVDGLLDSVSLTTTGAASGGTKARVSGTLTISSSGTGVVHRWAVQDGSPRTYVWDGRVKGVIQPGIYTAALTLQGPEGPARTTVQPLTVSKDHLPYRVKDLFGVAEGNQQGLAVHDGRFYVTTDLDSLTSRIDVYDGGGARVGTSPALAIGHGAELGWSTTTNSLWATNGGPTTPTKAWEISVDPATPWTVLHELDLSSLGPNGMIAVDDPGQRLLVFSGTKDAYRLTPVAFDGTAGASVPIAIAGTPQGIDLVGSELWVYTSLRGRNRVARYSVTPAAVQALSTQWTVFDLMNAGEGEGMSADNGALYVGAHAPNRVGVLEPVPDE